MFGEGLLEKGGLSAEVGDSGKRLIRREAREILPPLFYFSPSTYHS